MHRTTPRFWTHFESLPEAAQNVARKNFALLKENSSHPSLRFKKVGAFWSVRAGINYRALAVEDGGDFILVWIGSHDEYRRMIKHEG
jgi:hypothetical protein